MSLMGVSFEDGPAKGQSLMLERAPLFLRAVQSRNGRWDALDQKDDQASPRETAYAYIRVGEPGYAFIDYRGKGSRREGQRLATAEYWLVEPQPEQAVMHDNAAWRAWTYARPESAYCLGHEQIRELADDEPNVHSLGEVEPGNERCETVCMEPDCDVLLAMAMREAQDGTRHWVAWCPLGHVTFGLEPVT